MNTKYLCFSDIFVCSFVCIPTLLKKPSVSKYLTTLAFRRIIKKNSLNIVDDRQQRKGKNFNGYSIKKKKKTDTHSMGLEKLSDYGHKKSWTNFSPSVTRRL